MNRRVVLTVAAMLVAYPVLTEGGRTDLAWAACLLGIGVLALAFWVRQRSDVHANVEAVDTWLVIVTILVPAYIALQLVPLPLAIVRIVSPSRAAVADLLGAVTATPRLAPITVNSTLTFWYFVLLVAATLIFLVIAQLVRELRERDLVRLVVPLVVLAAIEAAIALVQRAGGLQMVGTYRNRDHLAGLLEMALPLTGGTAFALLPEHDEGPWFARRRVPGIAALCAAGLLMFTVLVKSGSKMDSSRACAGSWSPA